MNARNGASQKSVSIAFAISLFLHLALLFYGYILPVVKTDIPLEPRPPELEQPRLNAMLLRPPEQRQTPPPEPVPRTPEAPKKVPQPLPKVLSVPSGNRTAPVWTRKDQEEMDKFLEEQAKAAKPPTAPVTGRDLAQMALIIAAKIARQPVAEDIERDTSKTHASGKAVEQLSMEMYIAAFVQKMNRGANFVKSTPRVRGQHFGEVQITLNSDGSLKSYRVLRAGDQQAEINYIKNVIDVAGPFSAFPPDMKESMESLSIPICISPRFSGEGGKVFSRSGSKECAA